MTPRHRTPFRSLVALALVAASALVWVLVDQDRTRRHSAPTPPAARRANPAEVPLEAAPAREPSVASEPAPLASADSGERVERAPEPASDRQPLAVGALSGRVTDAAGQPLADALLSWAPLFEELGHPDLRLADLDHVRIRMVTRFATTDAKGDFRFDEPPPETERVPSAVWVTHPGHAAAPVVLAAGSAPWTWPGIACTTAEPFEVRVVDRRHEPVAGATVEQFLLFSAPTHDVADPADFARRVFWREVPTDASGRARPAAGSGATILRARHGQQTSRTWLGERPPPDRPIELVLTDAFWLAGQLRAEGNDAQLFDGPRVAVGFHDDHTGYDEVETSLRVRGDGSFGPARLPILAGVMMRAYVFGGEIVQQQVPDLPAPRPEQEVFVTFDVHRGERLRVVVVDPDGKGLERAAVSALAPHEGGLEVVASGWTDADGRVELRGLPRGNVGLEASKQGYASQTFDGELHVCPLPAGEALHVELRPAANLAGVVRSGGEPLGRFSLLYWTADMRLREERWFEDPEGRFRLENVPLGESLTLVALGPSLPQSDPLVLDVPAEGLEDVTIEVPSARIGRGLVYDGTTGKPLAGASVQLLTSAGGQAIGWREERTTSDAAGSFEIPVAPGNGAYAVAAPGFLLTLGYVPERDDPLIDLGITVLPPACSVQVEASGLAEGSYTDCVLFSVTNSTLGELRLGPDGTALVQGVRTGGGLWTLTLPDHTTVERELFLEPGEDGRLSFDLSGAAELSVTLVTGHGAPATGAQADRVRIHQASAQGARIRTQPFSGGETARIRALAAGPATVEVLSALGETLATRTLRLVAGSNETTVALGGPVRRLRLVDRGGRPLSSVRVLVTTPGRASGWYAERTTASDGSFSFGPLDADEVTLFAFPETHAIAWNRRVQLPPTPDAIAEVVIDLVSQLELTLVEEGAPAPGVMVLFSGEGLPAPFYYQYTSDARGLVFGPRCAEGSYDVAIHHAVYWPMRFPLRIAGPAAGGAGEQTLEVYSRGSLVLRAVDAEGNPASFVPFTLRHTTLGDVSTWIEDGRVEASDHLLATGIDGTLRVRGLPRGTYAWQANLPGGTLEGTLRVPPRGEGSALVTLP